MKKLKMVLYCFLAVALIGIGTVWSDNDGVIDWGLDEGIAEKIENLVVNILQVTKNPYDDEAQCWGAFPWSPGGEWIVYTAEIDSSGSDNNELCKMKSDGTGHLQLTDNEVCDSHGSFTPDGNKIIFQRRNDDTDNAEIWIMNSDGTEQTSLSQQHVDEGPISMDNCENKPRVSPAGTKIAFHTCDEDIWVMNIDGTNPLKVSGALDSCTKHSWSPNPEWVLFNGEPEDISYQRIHKVNADGSNLTKLSDESLELVLDDMTSEATWKCENWAFWSPDGQWIAYHVKYGGMYDYNDVSTLSIMKPDGTEKTHLVLAGSDQHVELVPLGDSGAMTLAPVQGAARNGDQWDWVCGPKSWSPDSNWIAFKMWNASDTNIFAYNIYTAEVVQLTAGYDDYRLWWSPDGRKILFRDRDGDTRDDDLGDNLDNDLLVINLAPWFLKDFDGAERDDVNADDTLEYGDLAMAVDVDVTTPGDDVTVMVAKYTDNPTGIAFDGAYWDLYIPDTNNITSITLRLYYTADQDANNMEPKWFNEDSNSWEVVSNYQRVDGGVTLDGVNYAGYIEITIDATTTPSLDQLSGTVFGVEGEDIRVPGSNNNWPCFISALF